VTATAPVIEASGPGSGAPLLEVRDVATHFKSPRGLVRSVDGVSFTLERGKTLGIVGESGSGKSVLSRTIMGLNPRATAVRSGQIFFEGRDISDLSDAGYRELWGRQMAMVFQDPMTSLNPVMRVGNQIAESLRHHLDMDRTDARETAIQLLRAVRIPEAEKRLRSYPHEMSGGMRQRVVIAIALACGPKLLMADEPTTALDVTVQAQILDLLAEQQRERFMGMILVTHDLGVVANRADDIAVMYAGRIVEKAPTKVLFRDMKMPYTQALMRAIPRVEMPSHTRLDAIGGRPPDLVHPPKGCPFNPRCPYAQQRCFEETPVLQEDPAVPGHTFACHFPLSSPNQTPPDRPVEVS
jgi:peptide/nickel transport system ATP-binding protein